MAKEMVPKAVVDLLMQQFAQQTAMFQQELSALRKQIEELNAIIREKDQIILNQNRARFGRSSEKTLYVFPAGQMSMFDIAGDGNLPASESSESAAPAQAVSTVKGHTRKAKRTMEELFSTLPVEEVVCDLPEKEKFNAQGEAFICIGKDEVRTELVREPGRMFLRKYFRKVYADRKGEERTGEAEIRQARTPAPLLQHSYASASVVADVIVKKYADALPLYRQEQIWKRQGLPMKRGSMANWIILTGRQYLQPFWNRMHEELLSQHVIHADETVLQVNKEPGRAASEESRFWAYASAKRAEKQIRLFRYESSRKGACAREFLQGFSGALVSDGYAGYNAPEGVTRAGCWTHMRRKWHEAMPKGATTENSLAAIGFDYCSRLFEVERIIDGEKSAAERHIPADKRLKRRQELAKPIITEYYNWLETIFQPSGKLRDAVVYARNQRTYLCAFLDDGDLELSNNQVENAIRPIVVGRKNWLFCDTPDGAEASALAFSILETAKANGLNPEAWLIHILSVLPDRFSADPLALIDDLLPWSPEMKMRFLA